MGEQNVLLRLRHPTKRAVFRGRQKFIKINLGWQWINSASFEIITLTGWRRMKASKNPCVLVQQERGWQVQSIVMK